MTESNVERAQYKLASNSGRIAILALLLTIWQGWETRLNNRISVRPFIMTINALSIDREKPGLLLSNVGLGPAIINAIKIKAPGSEWVDMNNSDGISQLLLAQGFEKKWLSGSTLKKGAVLAANEKIALMEVSDTINDNDVKKKIKQKLKLIRICVSYESLYNETFSNCKRL